ncbi:hypothetical protein V1291_000019 [Nitrobacteraceae bacterium AZCC 1564]
MKPLTDAQYALKAAVRRAVKKAGGPTAASEVTRVDAARLSRYGNPDCPEFAPIDVCFELDRAAGDEEITRALADLFDSEIIRRDANTAAPGDLNGSAARIAKASGDLVSASIEAAADGVITPREAQILEEKRAVLDGTVSDAGEVIRPLMVVRS